MYMMNFIHTSYKKCKRYNHNILFYLKLNMTNLKKQLQKNWEVYLME